MCGYSKSNCKIAFFKFSATFQICFLALNFVQPRWFGDRWAEWRLWKLAKVIEGDRKGGKSKSWVFPPWAPWSWRPWTTRPSHTVGILSNGDNYNIFFVFSITSIIFCWNELWPRKNIFFSVSTAFCLPRLEPGSLVCFEYPLQSDRFSLKMIHVKEML